MEHAGRTNRPDIQIGMGLDEIRKQLFRETGEVHIAIEICLSDRPPGQYEVDPPGRSSSKRSPPLENVNY